MHVEQAVDLSSGDPNEYGWLNLLYSPMPRAHFIDGSGWLGALGGEYAYSPLVRQFINYTGAASANTDAIINIMKERVEARYWLNQEGYQPVGAFPYNASLRWSSFRSNGTGGSIFAQVPEGTLLAVARKKNETFYFWLNYTGVQFNYLIGFAAGTFRFQMNVS
jgi:hypothetical protein